MAFGFFPVRAQQFICKRCGGLSNVERFEKTADGIPFARCEHCEAKNRTVDTGATPTMARQMYGDLRAGPTRSKTGALDYNYQFTQ